MGNRVVVYCDVSGTATSSADLIVVPHIRAAQYADACFRASGVAGTSVEPALSISGTTINVFQIAATTGQNYTIKVDGV